MPSNVVDSINAISSKDLAPDKLRSEIGTYYNPNIGVAIGSNYPTSPFKNYREKIKSQIFIKEIATSTQQIVPTKKFRVFVSGIETTLRDQAQWREHIVDTIKEGSLYYDHQFSLDSFEVENTFSKNYHHPQYEDKTKSYQTNQLLNYNLINYSFKNQKMSVGNIADLRTRYDDENYQVNSLDSLNKLMEEYTQRFLQYTGSVTDLDRKQRNIFLLNKDQGLISKDFFPFYYEKRMPSFFINSNNSININIIDRFDRILTRNGKMKNLMKSIKNKNFHSTRSFNIGTTRVDAEIHDVVRFISSDIVANFQESDNELFVVPEQEIYDGQIRNRFIDKINSVKMLSELRKILNSKIRNYDDIINSRPSESFFVGYKIEKFLDNDATLPIQTYYTTDHNFVDTQLKYGRKYIYKTKILIGIVGSSYSYSDVRLSRNDIEMENISGEIVQIQPDGFVDIASEKYRAYVDVTIKPSFQILEFQIDVDEVAFVDSPVLPPQVNFHNQSNRKSVEFFFSPMFTRVESVTSESEEETIRALVAVFEQDKRIVDLLRISKGESVRPEYFTGVYEIYRTKTPPKSEKDFINSYIASVDDSTGLVYPRDTMGLSPKTYNNKNGYFEDKIRPNTKYYYVFRCLTYHGTPSNFTNPYEIELINDSNGYKISVNEYKYPISESMTKEVMMKRLLKIVPNPERLFFSDSNKNSYKLDFGNMVEKGRVTKFKIRITSKHTGKKIDINLNLTLKEDENSFS